MVIFPHCQRPSKNKSVLTVAYSLPFSTEGNYVIIKLGITYIHGVNPVATLVVGWLVIVEFSYHYRVASLYHHLSIYHPSPTLSLLPLGAPLIYTYIYLLVLHIIHRIYIPSYSSSKLELVVTIAGLSRNVHL